MRRPCWPLRCYGAGENSARTSQIGDSVNAAKPSFVAPIFPGRRRLDTFQPHCRGRTRVLLRSRAATGNELWTSDGTEAGTTLVEDVQPGPQAPFRPS